MYRPSHPIEETVPSRLFSLIIILPLKNIYSSQKFSFPSVASLYIILVVLFLQHHILFLSLVFFFTFFNISKYKLYFTLIFINLSTSSLINNLLLKNFFTSRVSLPSLLFSTLKTYFSSRKKSPLQNRFFFHSIIFLMRIFPEKSRSKYVPYIVYPHSNISSLINIFPFKFFCLVKYFPS